MTPMFRRLLTCAALAFPFVQDLAAQQREWPYTMDFGPYLMTTFDGGGRSDFTYKGAVVRLPQGAVAFDTELLRVSAAWTDGWLRLRGTAYDGAHGPMPALAGRKLLETARGPGWANAGKLNDPRAIPYGPLPRSHGAWRGVHLHGDEVALEYVVGGMNVMEHFAFEGDGNGRAFAREMVLAPSMQEQVMVVMDVAEHSKPGTLEWNGTIEGAPPLNAFAMFQLPEPGDGVLMDGDATGFSRLLMGAPSAADYLDVAAGNGATVHYVPGFATPQGSKGEDTALPKLHDGKAAQNSDDTQHNTWFERRRGRERERQRNEGRFVVDLRAAVEVSRVDTFSWHRAERAVQQYELFGSAAEKAPDVGAEDPAAAGWQRIAGVDTSSMASAEVHGVAIGKQGGLGRFRHLLFHVRSGGTFFSEIDVWAGKTQPPPIAPRYHAAALKVAEGEATLRIDGTRMLLVVPPHRQRSTLKLLHGAGDEAAMAGFVKTAQASPACGNLAALAQPGPLRWGEPLVTKGERGADDGAYAVDTLTIPFDNLFGSRMRTCAFDFFRDGRAAVTTWNGDVFVVSGIDDDLDRLEWRRFATGLHDPLGLRIVDDVVHVHGRDGITRLHDLDNNGEADFYECFNNDVTVTNAFHEFAFDLQTDPEGNFYCSKGAPVNPGGRGFMKIVPHHGTIMKISKDGSSLSVVAAGLRAPNGIGVSPDGRVITSGDNEGTWMPRCRLNWITDAGFFGGVVDTAQRKDVPASPSLPLCWFPMEIDNSGGGQTWVTSDRWGGLQGRLLHLSYGTCGLYLVLKEQVLTEQGNDVVQGGVVRFPCGFSSSAMRARFSPVDGQLYVCGFQGWQTSAAREGGFHRVRFTGQPFLLPTALRTTDKGIYLTFDVDLDAKTAADPDSFGVEIWNYLWSQNYGSPEVSLLHPDRKVEQGKPNRDALKITAAKLSNDKRTVFLAVDEMQPCMQMKIQFNVDSAAGARMQGEVHNTIHRLQADKGF